MPATTDRPCGSRYHVHRPLPPAVAILTRVRGLEQLIGEKIERCFDHTVNLLTYWEPFWEREAIDAEELAQAELRAARARGPKETEVVA